MELYHVQLNQLQGVRTSLSSSFRLLMIYTEQRPF